MALGYHTYPQLAAGLLLGSAVASAWRAAFHAFIAPALAAQPGRARSLTAATALASALFTVAFVRKWVVEGVKESGGA